MSALTLTDYHYHGLHMLPEVQKRRESHGEEMRKKSKAVVNPTCKPAQWPSSTCSPVNQLAESVGRPGARKDVSGSEYRSMGIWRHRQLNILLLIEHTDFGQLRPLMHPNQTDTQTLNSSQVLATTLATTRRSQSTHCATHCRMLRMHVDAKASPGTVQRKGLTMLAKMELTSIIN